MLVKVITGNLDGQSFHLRGTTKNTCTLDVNGKWQTFPNSELEGVPMGSDEQELLDHLNKNYQMTRGNKIEFDFIDELREEVGDLQVDDWISEYKKPY